MLLQQETYKDDMGREILAKNIFFAAPFVYIADGFFRWTCSNCRQDNSCRAHFVSGVVFNCSHCNAESLLLRSDCDNINDLCKRVNLLKDQIEVHAKAVEEIQRQRQFIADAIFALAKEVETVKNVSVDKK